MSKLRDAIAFAPKFVGVEGYGVDRWAFPLLAIFDADATKSTTVFDVMPGESIEDRLDPLKGLYMAKGAVSDKVSYFIGLMTLAAYSYAVSKGRTDLEDKRNSLAGYLAKLEASYVDMASVYSVSEASVQGQWG